MHTDLKGFSIFDRLDAQKHLHWVLLVLVILSFIVILYPGLGTKKYEYQVGDVAKRDIKAPEDFFVEDIAATENKRIQAAENVLTVYDHQTNLSTQIGKQIKKAFEDLNKIYTETEASLLPPPLI